MHPGAGPERWLVATAIVASLSAAVLIVLWFGGPSALGMRSETPTRSVTATVTRAVECGQSGTSERVTFTLDGQRHRARYDACGHREGERREVAVPVPAARGPLVVHDVGVAAEPIGARRPVTLLLLALSCASGGVYAYLLWHRPRAAVLGRGRHAST